MEGPQGPEKTEASPYIYKRIKYQKHAFYET